LATFGDLKTFVERDGWTEEPNLARGKRRVGDHWRYRKERPDGTILRTKVSHAVRDEIGSDLFHHILRDQLGVDEERFWAVVRGLPIDRAPAEPNPVTTPGWLVQRLMLTVGLSEEAVRAMAPEEAHAAWVEYQTRERL
jgi:hypothetical protein